MDNRWLVSFCALFFVSCYDFSIPQIDSGFEGGVDSSAESMIAAGENGQCGPGGLSCQSMCVPNDKLNCGTCGNDCTALPHVNGQVECVGGACVVTAASCAPKRGNCNGLPNDGCETDLSTTAHCGSCTSDCSNNPLGKFCVPASTSESAITYQCATTCPPNASTNCDGTCVDLTTNSTHCGDCATACPETARGQAICNGGKCSMNCNQGSHACKDKCVANTSPDSCGASCTPCDVPLNSTPKCDGTKCSFECNTGFLLCNKKCIPNDEHNCGNCGNDCSALPNVTGAVSCNNGVCEVDSRSCKPGFTHCSKNANDFCETDLSKPATCGDCNTKCGTNLPLCALKTGSSSTSPVYECTKNCTGATPDLCGDSCVNKKTDPNNCGDCGHVCEKPSGSGQAVCENGTCKKTCNTGYHLCDENACLSNKSSDSCGSQCEPCPDPPNARATCDGTKCGFSCTSSSYLPCDINKGCIISDNKNCGKCGNDCTAKNQVCDDGTCVGCISNSDCKQSGARYCVDQQCKVCSPGDSSTCKQPTSDCQQVTCTSSGTCSSATKKTDGVTCNGGKCFQGNCVECRSGSDCNTSHCAQNHCSECDSNGGCEERVCRKAACSSTGVCSYQQLTTGTSCNSTGGTCNANGSCVNEPYPECSSAGAECPFNNTRRGQCTGDGYCTVGCNSKADCPQVTGANVTCSYTCGLGCSGASCPVGMICDGSGHCYWRKL